MATLKLTDRLASNLPANDITSKSKAKEYGDQQVPGLKLAVGKSFGKPPHKSWLFRGTLNGTKICVQLGSFLTTNVAEARAKALQCKSSIENGIDPRVKPTVEACPVLTFVELSKQYMEWARQAKRSAKSDESKLKHHLLKRWGDRDIASITRRDIESYHLEIISQLSPATGNRHLSLVSQMFAKAKDWGLIDNNPARGIQKARENNIITTHLNKDEVMRLFAALDQDPNVVARCVIKFLTMTGVRSQEALQAKWQHVDLINASLYLPHTKAGKARHITLNEAALSVLGEMQPISGNGVYVFPGKDPLKPYNNIKKPLHRVLQAAVLPKIRPHDLRHTYASLLVTEGVSLFQVQALLGHSSPIVTQRYSHLAKDSLRETSQIVATLMGYNAVAEAKQPSATAS